MRAFQAGSGGRASWLASEEVPLFVPSFRGTSREPWDGRFEVGRSRTKIRGVTMPSMRPLEARYDHGLLRPTEPLALEEGQRVGLILVPPPTESRWNMAALQKASKADDEGLEHAGLEAWAAALDAEDRE